MAARRRRCASRSAAMATSAPARMPKSPKPAQSPMMRNAPLPCDSVSTMRPKRIGSASCTTASAIPASVSTIASPRSGASRATVRR